MAFFLNNLGLLLIRFVTGALVCFFAARELANRSTILYETLEYFSIGAPDIVKVFVGCILMLLGGMLIIGFWTRFVALALLVLLAIGGYCWLPQESQIYFHLESLYGMVFFYLFLVGGGQWAVSRRKVRPGQSVLDSEQSILAASSKPSVFDESDDDGETVPAPPPVVSENDHLDDNEEDESSDNEDEDKDTSQKPVT